MRRHAAFTLIEMMVVAAVGAGVVVASAIFLRQAAAARERLDAAVAVNAEADAALFAVVDALRHAVLAAPEAGGGGLRTLEDDPGGVRLEMEPDDEAGGAGVSTRLTLNTWQREPVRTGRAESDWREVEFFVEVDPSSLAPRGLAAARDSGPVLTLKRRRDPTLQALEAGERGGVEETVAAGIVGFEVLAFDPLVQRWVQQWPPVEDPTPRLPEAVRVELALAGEDGRVVRRSRLIGGLP